MTITVLVDLPDLKTNLSKEDRGALRWAGVSMAMLRSSWGASLAAVLRRFWPNDSWLVSVRAHPTGPPRFESRHEIELPSTEKMELVVLSAGFSWCASIGHITMLRMAARKRAANE